MVDKKHNLRLGQCPQWSCRRAQRLSSGEAAEEHWRGQAKPQSGERSPRIRQFYRLVSRKAAKDNRMTALSAAPSGLDCHNCHMTVGYARAFGTCSPTAVFFCRFATC